MATVPVLLQFVAVPGTLLLPASTVVEVIFKKRWNKFDLRIAQQQMFYFNFIFVLIFFVIVL